MQLTLTRKKRDNAVFGDGCEMTLAELRMGRTARVKAVATSDADLELKLREVGFSEGDEVELVGRGPFGGQPLAVRLNRTVVAMRRAEAQAIAIVHD